MRFFVLGSYMNANFLQMARLPIAGESMQAQGMWHEHGGKGLNLGIGLHHLGLSVKILLGIGHDDAGKAVLEVLEQEGMDTSAVMPLGPHSGYGVGFIDTHGENMLATFAGANAQMNAQHVLQHFGDMTEQDWVCAQFEAPEEAILAAFKLAQQTNAKTYLNPSPWYLPSRELLALTDVLVVNEIEAALMFGVTKATTWSADNWKKMLPDLIYQFEFDCKLLLVTLGSNGVVGCINKSEILYHPAWPITQIDATGAGDAFSCGLLWGYAQGLPLAQILPFANACGALVAAAQDVLVALPRVDQVEQFILEHKSAWGSAD